MHNLYTIMFWATITCVALAGIMGVIGIWVPNTSFGRKLFATDVAVAITCVIIAIITKFMAR